MSIYRKLDPMSEYRTEFVFKGKREQIDMVNMPSMAYPNHHIDTEIPHGSRDHVILPNTVKVTFNLKLNQQIKHVVNNVGRALIKKNVLMIGSKEIDTINNADIYHKVNKWFKGMCRCRKSRWHSTNSDNYGICNQIDVW